MNLKKILLLVSIVFLLISSSIAMAESGFDWIEDFNIRAEADQSGFRARLSARFKIDDVHINAVFSNVECPADAYIVFRLGEMSAKPTEYVIEQYKSKKNKGWGALAKSLGIKPGSEEFHALKLNSDIYESNDKNKKKEKNKGKNKKK